VKKSERITNLLNSRQYVTTAHFAPPVVGLIIKLLEVLYYMFIEWLGISAGAIMNISLIPQIIKTYKTKSSGDFSLAYLSTWLLGMSMWVIYGVVLNLLAVIVSNITAIGLMAILLTLILKYRKKNAPNAEKNST
jgi:MtN3 and saliva related transmembrane protein